MTDLSRYAEELRSFPGITRKNAIHEVVDLFPTSGFDKVIAAEGEDAAVIDCGDKCVLFATDGIMESLLNSDPYLAGYYAVLVNVNDIAAMGGRPLAMVDVMSINQGRIEKDLLRGIQDGVKKFSVPIVGGHTHPDCNYNSIEISIIGSAKKGDVLLSSTAQPGDDIVFVFDLKGHYPESTPLAYNSTMERSEEIVQAQLEAAAEVAEKHLAHSCKDMSNPGHIGTLGMMLESSDAGATVDVTRIPKPDGVDEIRWAKTYQGCGFVFACDPANSQEIIEIFSKTGCTGAVVGKVDSTKVLKLTDGNDTVDLFDFGKDIITGVKVRK